MTARDNSSTASITPLDRRSIEIEVAAAFNDELRERLGSREASDVFAAVVRRLASASAQRMRSESASPGLRELWSVWQLLGSDGRLDLHLEELTDSTLRFYVSRCAYAEMYRASGRVEEGIAFSCRRDTPFAEALVPNVVADCSRTILEGSPRCEFTFTLEDQ